MSAPQQALKKGRLMGQSIRDYSGSIAVLATIHGKESVIAPAFREQLGIEVQVAAIDTDSFGTFAGEVPRKLSQFESARAKAVAAIEKTGMQIGIASEGTIGPHPMIPFVSSDFETVVFFDSENDLLIQESYRSSNIVASRTIAKPDSDLEEFLRKADFPNHGLIVRSSANNTIIKGIVSPHDLERALGMVWQEAEEAEIESDFRASFSPSRMANIAHCTELLVNRIKEACPECAAPGWGSVEPVFGLPCVSCGEAVSTVVREYRNGCSKCDYMEHFPAEAQQAEARFCQACNP